MDLNLLITLIINLLLKTTPAVIDRYVQNLIKWVILYQDRAIESIRSLPGFKKTIKSAKIYFHFS